MDIPTPENINALPEGLRGYIHSLETRCDPVGEFQVWKAGEDAILALVIENKGLKKRIVELEAEKRKPKRLGHGNVTS